MLILRMALAGALLVGVVPTASALVETVDVKFSEGSCSSFSGGTRVRVAIDDVVVWAEVCTLIEETDQEGTGYHDCGNMHGILVRYDGRIVGACADSNVL
jgi:hypothetical protein